MSGKIDPPEFAPKGHNGSARGNAPSEDLQAAIERQTREFEERRRASGRPRSAPTRPVGGPSPAELTAALGNTAGGHARTVGREPTPAEQRRQGTLAERRKGGGR